ncbi:MAG: PTS maltose transporter subunit IIBC [Veillonella sp.]|nr:PTS maltose transporter subunit IIBC [Veillonella sp.]
MISVLTVCGNGIGSSLMLKMKIEEICAENELAEQFDDKNVAIVRSYINKKKITEDVLEALKQAAQ